MHSKKSSLFYVLFILVAVISISGCSENASNAAMPVVSATPVVMATPVIKATKIEPAVKYYGGDENIDADVYNINGNTYINLNDVSSLFKTKIIYDNANNTISIGDVTRVNAAYYVSDLSAYPDLSIVIDLPPFEIILNGGSVDYKYVTKNVLFEDMIKKIDQKLKTDGFTVTTEEQYTALTRGTSVFKQGKMENTYIKYKNNNVEAQSYAIQIIDSGVNKNNLPIITVRMKR